MSAPNYVDSARSRLSPSALATLHALLHLADKSHFPVYLVGGFVRDILLDRPSHDVDLSLEGNAIALATSLAAKLSLRAKTHRRFNTAEVVSDGFTFHLAMARSETYKHPGALPTVRPAGIRDDLARRDFTINALALGLNGPDAGVILDLHDGRSDLNSRLIRILHPLSFQDDATRMFRALLYATRLGFAIEPATAERLAADLPFVATISGSRIRNELAIIAEEPLAADIIDAAAQVGLLSAIHAAIRPDKPMLAAIRLLLAAKPLAPVDETLLCLLSTNAREGEAGALTGRLDLIGKHEHALFDWYRLRHEAPHLACRPLRPSEIVAILRKYQPSAVWALALYSSGAAAERAQHYLRNWRHIRPALDGRDLAALGVPPGPLLGDISMQLRNARIDGLVTSREQEIAFVERLLQKGS